MILSQISIRNIALLFAAMISTTMLFTTGTAFAAPAGKYYQAELSTPTAKKSFVHRGVFVRCADTSCTAPKANTRPDAICVKLSRKFGALKSFTVADVAFSDEKLAKCNR